MTKTVIDESDSIAEAPTARPGWASQQFAAALHTLAASTTTGKRGTLAVAGPAAEQNRWPSAVNAPIWCPAAVWLWSEPGLVAGGLAAGLAAQHRIDCRSTNVSLRRRGLARAGVLTGWYGSVGLPESHPAYLAGLGCRARQPAWSWPAGGSFEFCSNRGPELQSEAGWSAPKPLEPRPAWQQHGVTLEVGCPRI